MSATVEILFPDDNQKIMMRITKALEEISETLDKIRKEMAKKK